METTLKKFLLREVAFYSGFIWAIREQCSRQQLFTLGRLLRQENWPKEFLDKSFLRACFNYSILLDSTSFASHREAFSPCLNLLPSPIHTWAFYCGFSYGALSGGSDFEKSGELFLKILQNAPPYIPCLGERFPGQALILELLDSLLAGEISNRGLCFEKLFRRISGFHLKQNISAISPFVPMGIETVWAKEEVRKLLLVGEIQDEAKLRELLELCRLRLVSRISEEDTFVILIGSKCGAKLSQKNSSDQALSCFSFADCVFRERDLKPVLNNMKDE